MNKSKILNEANEVQVFMEVATKIINIVQDLMKLNWELFCMARITQLCVTRTIKDTTITSTNTACLL